MIDIIATESTEKHGRIKALIDFFSCPFVGFVAICLKLVTQLSWFNIRSYQIEPVLDFITWQAGQYLMTGLGHQDSVLPLC